MDAATVIVTIPVRTGDKVNVSGAEATVLRAGVTAHKDGTATPIVALSDGRRITGEAVFYLS